MDLFFYQVRANHKAKDSLLRPLSHSFDAVLRILLSANNKQMKCV